MRPWCARIPQVSQRESKVGFGQPRRNLAQHRTAARAADRRVRHAAHSVSRSRSGARAWCHWGWCRRAQCLRARCRRVRGAVEHSVTQCPADATERCVSVDRARWGGKRRGSTLARVLNARRTHAPRAHVVLRAASLPENQVGFDQLADPARVRAQVSLWRDERRSRDANGVRARARPSWAESPIVVAAGTRSG